MSADIEWHAVSKDGSTDLLRVGETSDSYVAEWPGRLLQTVSKTTLQSELRWEAELDDRARRKFLSGPVQAFERHARGALSFHAGAISRGGRAIAVLGASGAGKSTCVYDACTRGGWSFMADDVVHLDGVLEGAPRVVSAEDVLGMTKESRVHFGMPAQDADKSLLDAPPRALASAPLAAWVELAFGDGDEVTLERRKGLRAVGVLMASQVRLVVASAEVHVRDMAAIEALLASTPVYRLTRPRSFAHIARAEEALRSLLSGVEELH